MNQLTVLARPTQAQIKIDPNPKPHLSDGFNFPTFRLVNKHARVALSQATQNSGHYLKTFAVANSKGWFAAIRFDGTHSIILSPLEDLRSAFKDAKEGETAIFNPQRVFSIPSEIPHIITFAANDTRLLVALRSGHILAYDALALFSPGTEAVSPAHAYQGTEATIANQLLPNPGTDSSVADLVAVVRGDGSVQLLSGQLVPQGGWTGQGDATAVTAAWSPKGKQIAIGLRSGDLLAFAPSNTTTMIKHIPPTALASLLNVNWLGPGYTLQTTYAPAPETSESITHVITVDTKASTATYVVLTSPFAMDNRPHIPYLVTIPRWDEVSGTVDESRSLFVVGDRSSVDIEIVGTAGGRWLQQSQENPVTLPLDIDQEDTTLLCLDLDFTDTTAGAPLLYVHLNDGTLQAWYADHPQRYPGIITPSLAGNATQGLADTSMSEDVITKSATTAVPKPPSSGFAAFAQSGPTAFGTSAFGQNQSNSGAFGQSPSSNQSTPSPFASATPTAFGASTFGTGAFGSPFNQQTPASSSAFGGLSQPAFGSTSFPSQTPAAFGNTTSSGSTQGGGAFGSFSNNAQTNVFGQGSFGSSPSAAPMTREASMADASSEGLGGLSLGSTGDAHKSTTPGGIFGSLPPPQASDSTSTPSTFGGGIKPPTGFGAFGNSKLNDSPFAGGSAFGQPTFGQSAFSSPSTSANQSSFPSSSAQPSAFGQTAFGQTGFASVPGGQATPQPAFGKSSFGQSAFGQSAFGTGAFGQSSFAPPATTEKPSVSATPPSSTGAFSGFAKNGSAGFMSALQNTTTPGENTPANEKGTTQPQSGEGAFGGFKTQSVGGFGSFSTGATSAFGKPSDVKTPDQSKKAAVPGLRDDADSSPDSSPSQTPTMKPKAVPVAKDQPIPSSSFGAFGNLKSTPSAFKPATGFGAFGNTADTSSPFYKPPESKPAVSAFAPISGTSSASTAPKSTAPTFGAPSALGATQPTTTTPTKTPAKVSMPSSGGFGSFSGGSSTLSAFSSSSKSFGELLKTGGGDPIKPSAPAFALDSRDSGQSSDSKSTPLSAFGTPPKPTASPPITPSIKIQPASPPAKTAPTTSTTSSTNASSSRTSPKPSSPLSSGSPITSSAKAAAQPSGSPTTAPTISAFPSGAARSLERSESVETVEGRSVESSFGNLSFTSEGSYVEVSGGEDAEAGETGTPEGSDQEEEADDRDGFLSDEFSSGSEEEDLSEEEVPIPGDESEEEGGSSAEESPQPTLIPLPPSRSPSATPQPETPSRLSPSSSTSSESKAKPLSPLRETSTTPPGTPEKETSSLKGRAGSVPATSTSGQSPFGIGLGRPSTRPTRSSPLAGVPVSLSDEGGGSDTLKVKEEPVTPSAVSPKPVYGVLPLADSEGSGKSPRPKTPPLLSSFGSAKESVSTPALFNLSEKAASEPPKPIFATTSSSPPLPKAKPTTTNPQSTFNMPQMPSMAAKTAMPSFPTSALFGTSIPAPTGGVGDFFLPSRTTTTPSDQGAARQPTSEFGLGRPPFATSKSEPLTSKPTTSAFGGGGLFSAPITPSTNAVSTGAAGFFGGAKPIAPLPAFGGPPGGLFGATTSATPQKAPSQGPFQAGGLFGSTPMPAGGLFGSAPTQNKGTPLPFSLLSGPASTPSSSSTTTSPFGPPPNAQNAGGSPPKIPMPDNKLQSQCLMMLASVAQEFKHVGILARAASTRAAEISKLPEGPRRNLSQVDKLSIAELKAFAQLLEQKTKAVKELNEQRETQVQAVRELRSGMLKAGTRREEIARFNKAKTDSDFSRMLRSRTLGPEHQETQFHLRRKIRNMTDRVEKLENHMKTSKKKLNQVKSGHPGIHAPSLDTISRTYRNIDIAIRQQTAEIAAIKERLTSLRMSESALPPDQSPPRDARLPDAGSRRPYNVTPDVAATTAAALNAERSAQRLKTVLFAVRQKPLSNKKAEEAPLPPLTFGESPEKPKGMFSLPSSGQSLFSNVPPPSDEAAAALPADWTLPEDHFNPSTPLPGRRGAGAAPKKHGSVPLKRSPGAAQAVAATPPSFDWGPLPNFGQPSGSGVGPSSPSPLGGQNFFSFKKG